MLDSSSPIKLGDRASLFKAAFSMAHRNMIADIALTSAGALDQKLDAARGPSGRVRGLSQTQLPRLFWTSGRLTSYFHDAGNDRLTPVAPGFRTFNRTLSISLSLASFCASILIAIRTKAAFLSGWSDTGKGWKPTGNSAANGVN